MIDQTTENFYQLETFDTNTEQWVYAPMSDPNPAGRYECEAQVASAIEFAPGLASRKFRCRQITVKTTVIEYDPIQEGA